MTFALEQHSRCGYDYLLIQEKDRSIAKKLCGPNRPKDFTSKDNELFLEFKSDGSVTSKGFLAAFASTNKSVSTSPPSPGINVAMYMVSFSTMSHFDYYKYFYWALF